MIKRQKTDKTDCAWMRKMNSWMSRVENVRTVKRKRVLLYSLRKQKRLPKNGFLFRTA